MSLTGNASTDNLLVGNVKGLNSIHGKSAYELAVIHGFEGTEEEWIASLKGEKGDAYILTEADKEEIADIVAVDNLQESAEKYIDSVIETKDLEVTRTATGSAITIESSQAPLQNLKLFGKTEQDGTPTPTEPIELKSVGDSGSFSVTVYGKNLIAITAESTTRAQITYTVNKDKGFITASGTASIADSLMICENMRKILNTRETYRFSGIFTVKIEKKDGTIEFKNGGDITITDDMVSIIPYLQPSGEWGIGISKTQTYYPMCIRKSETDTTFEPCLNKPLILPYTLRSVGNIKDEVDFARGVKIQRFSEVDLGTLTWYYDGSEHIRSFYASYPTLKPAGMSVCAKYKGVTSITTFLDKQNVIYLGNVTQAQSINVRTDVTYTDTNAFKSAMSGTMLVYELAEPIETPLTETELNAYRQLHTNKVNTTILSEADMEVDYYINKPNAQAIGNIHSQVNKDYFKLQQAIISTGGN